MTQIYRGLIVGQQFRKGGRIIQEMMQGGQELMLRPDPYGEATGTPHQDAAAVAVYVELYMDVLSTQVDALLSCGLDIQELVDEGEFHLGYAARSDNKQLVKKNQDGQRLVGCDQLLQHMLMDHQAQLEWGPNGESLIKMEIL